MHKVHDVGTSTSNIVYLSLLKNYVVETLFTSTHLNVTKAMWALRIEPWEAPPSVDSYVIKGLITHVNYDNVRWHLRLWYCEKW